MNLLKTITLAKLALITVLVCGVGQAHAHKVVTEYQERSSLLQYVIDTQPTLANLLTKAGLTPILSGNDTYTLLAPPEQELKNLENESPQKIRTILSGHILKGSYKESDLKDGATVETLAGTKVTICRKKDYTLVDGVRIVEANKVVKNGVVHALGGIIKS
ncbi:fasciclin domain-containing protein [Pontibacter sp. MBLB2868]|uniref:fasciclin domain-containing protein n=1 Tax=Pontibacter sp. MBLB2868 TaxID=3451555 RepID=UPI003F75597B